MTNTRTQLTDAEVVAEAVRRLRERAATLPEKMQDAILDEAQDIERGEMRAIDETEMQMLRALLGVE